MVSTRPLSEHKLTADIPNLKRRCEKLREETEELEEEYEKRRLQAQSNLLKTIKEYEQKKAACKAKIEELNKLVGEWRYSAEEDFGIENCNLIDATQSTIVM